MLRGYLGRVLGIGKTSEGEIAGVYAVSGRSEESKSRLARVVDEGLIKKVSVGPVKEATEEQMKTGNLLFYNAMIMTDKLCPDSPFSVLPYIVITNGVHTDTIFEARRARYPLGTDELVLHNTLALFGHEPDKPISTPRIAGEILDDSTLLGRGGR